MGLIQFIKKIKFGKSSLKKQILYALVFTLTLWFVLSTSAVPNYSKVPTSTDKTVIEKKVRELAKNDVEKNIPRRNNYAVKLYDKKSAALKANEISQIYNDEYAEHIKKKIRELAKSDVENDISRRNDYAVKLYDKKTSTLKTDDILQIYDNEYTLHLDEKKSNFWKQLPSKNEWVAAIAIFLLFTFNDVLKEWITNIIKYIGISFWNLLSRNTFFYIISLQKYRNGLIEKYQQSHFSYLPQRPLDLHEIYVPLDFTANSENRIDTIHGLKEPRLIFIGESGSGKSMLLKYITFSYAKGRFKNNYKWNKLFSDKPIPILLELRRLNDSDKTLQQHFVDALDRDGFSNGERFVEHYLQHGKLMLLLDGLDEVNSNILWRVIRDIKDLLDKNSGCRMIITCRTPVYKDEFATELNKAGGSDVKILTIADFNEEQIRCFLNLWQRDMPPGRSIDNLRTTLLSKNIVELTQRPLILSIIAYLYTYKDLTFAHSLTEFYRKSTDILLNQWYSEGNQFLLDSKKRILQQLALFYQEQQQNPYRLDSQKVLNYIRDIIRKLDIDIEPNQAKSLLEEIINRSGLMMAIDNGKIYQFVHRTFQEFFVAEALLEEKQEQSNNRVGFAFFAEQIQEKITINEKYLIEKFHQEQNRWQEIVKFWCGLSKNPIYIIKNVYQENKIFALECLAEIQDTTLNSDLEILAENFIDEFTIPLAAGTNNHEIERIIRALSSLASNRAFEKEENGRNVNKIFNLFKEFIEIRKENVDYKIAVNVLSMTNNAEAANILINQYKQINVDEELCQILDQALIRMGDIAVTEIEKYVTNESINQVIDTLVSIRTQNALQVLVTWLWHKDEILALRSALLLASLIGDEEYEEKCKETLNLCQLPQVYSQQTSFDWIAKIYKIQPNSNIHIILEQIAYLIAKHLKKPIELLDNMYIHGFDPKIIIPICFIEAIDQINLQTPSIQTSSNIQKILDTTEGLIKQEMYETASILYENFIKELCGQDIYTIWGFLILNLYPKQLTEIVDFLLAQNNSKINNLMNLGLEKEKLKKMWTIVYNNYKNIFLFKLLFLNDSLIFIAKEQIFFLFNTKKTRISLEYVILLDSVTEGIWHRLAFLDIHTKKFRGITKWWEGRVIAHKKLARPCKN